VKRKKDIASEFGIPASTSSTILNDEDKILKAVEEAPCSPQALDSLRVLRKYMREQPEIPDEICSAFNAIENFTDRRSSSKNKKIIKNDRFLLKIVPS